MWTKSKTEIDDPKRNLEKIEKAAPILAKLRRDKDAPM
jgi:hypothetical protein